MLYFCNLYLKNPAENFFLQIGGWGEKEKSTTGAFFCLFCVRNKSIFLCLFLPSTLLKFIFSTIKFH